MRAILRCVSLRLWSDTVEAVFLLSRHPSGRKIFAFTVSLRSLGITDLRIAHIQASPPQPDVEPAVRF